MSSLLGAKVKKQLNEYIKKQLQKAVEEENMKLASQLQTARKLINRGAWKTRRPNPYNKFMSVCLKGEKDDSLADAQSRMRKCALRWNQLSDEEKKKWEEKGEILVDYL